MLSLSAALPYLHTCCVACAKPRFGAKSQADDEQSAVSLATVWTAKCADGSASTLTAYLHQIKIAFGSLFRNQIKFTNIMGAYKGRRSLRQRKKRFAENQRIKALATAEKATTPLPSAAEQGRAKPRN